MQADWIKAGKAALEHPQVNGLMMETCPTGVIPNGGEQFITDVLASGKDAMFLMPRDPPKLNTDGHTYLKSVQDMMKNLEATGVDIATDRVVFVLAVYLREDTKELSGFIDGSAPLSDALECMKAHPLHSK